MPEIDYQVSKDGLQINVSPIGQLTSAQTVSYFKRLAQDPHVKQGAVEVVDFKSVTDFSFSFDEGKDIIYTYHSLKTNALIQATIFICENTLAFGIGRMLQTLHEIANPDHRVLVVQSREELDSVLKDLQQ